MRPLKRQPQSKYKGAKTFRKHSKRTHPRNVKAGAMRGGIRL